MLIAAGLGIILYPTISNKWNDYRNQIIINEYSSDIQEIDSDELEREWKLARAYNSARTVNIATDAFGNEKSNETADYSGLLDPSGNGVMGYLEIPDIDQRLPIYHGTSEKALEKGCGHLSGTSLPVGGRGSHAVIAGHRGLTSARLFTDLDKLKEGSRFNLHVLDKVLAYEVDQIKVVLPENTEDIQIVPGKDYVTLVTCTPYGVNSHRLLIRGHRTKYAPEQSDNETTAGIDPTKVLLILFALTAVLLIIIIYRIKKVKER